MTTKELVNKLNKNQYVKLKVCRTIYGDIALVYQHTSSICFVSISNNVTGKIKTNSVRLSYTFPHSIVKLLKIVIDYSLTPVNARGNYYEYLPYI